MRILTIATTLAAAITLAACANDTLIGSGTTTAALPPKPKVDPACATLANRIDGLRKEGVVERAEAAAKGKSRTVSVKRASLAQLTELDKANAEFQSRCSTLPRAAQAPKPASTPVVAKQAQAAATTAVAAKQAQAAATTAVQQTNAAAPKR